EFPGINTEEWYATIGRQVDDLDTTVSSNIIRRVVSDTMQFFLEIANEELSTYIEINRPISNVVQERTEYTNVNNGIDNFGRRNIASHRTDDVFTNGQILDNRSLEKLLSSNLSDDKSYTSSK